MRFSLLPVLTRYSDRVNSLNFIFFSEKAKLSDRITRHFFKNLERETYFIQAFYIILIYLAIFIIEEGDTKYGDDLLLGLIVYISYLFIERYILKFNLIEKINSWHDFISLESGKNYKMINVKTRWFEQRDDLFPINNYYSMEELTIYSEEIKDLIREDFNSRKNSYNSLREYKHSDILNVINKNLSINANKWYGEYHYAGELNIKDYMNIWTYEYAFVFYQVPSYYRGHRLSLKDAVEVKVLSLAELYCLRVGKN